MERQSRTKGESSNSMDSPVAGPAGKSKRKRGTVAAACELCRSRKLKCDGQRPKCTRCVAGEAECVYTAQDGQTRQDALRVRMERIEKDHNSMLDLLNLLRQTPLSEAEELLKRMRSGDGDSFAFLESVRSQSDHDSVQSTSMVICGDEGSPSAHGMNRYMSPESTRDSPDWKRRRMRTRDIPELPHHFEIPDEGEFRRAIKSFHDCSGKLFHICSHELIESSFDEIFQGAGQQPRSVALCRISSIAAVGCLYMRGRQGDHYKDTFYQVAKALLDSCIEADSLVATTFCTLIAMYNVMSHAKVALAYVELGISLSRKHQVHTLSRPPELSVDRWINGKRAWRTLIFFGAWISATLGYLSGNEWDAPTGTNLAQLEDAHQSAIEDKVQIAMVKIAVLKRNILRINVEFPQLSSSTVDTISHDLRQWYACLPPSMQLSHLLDETSPHFLSTELRRTVYNVHLLYLGALMLLYRRIAFHIHCTGSNLELGESAESSITQLALESALAAEQTARILGLLIDEDGIVQSCWIVIFQSYTAGTLLLHRLAQNQLLQSEPATWTFRTLERVEKCLKVLETCGEVDAVALRFHQTLTPYFEKLRSAAPGTAIPDNLSMKAQLYDLILLPFGHSDRHDFEQSQGDDVGFALHSQVDLMISSQYQNDRRRSDSEGDRVSLTACSLLAGLRPGYTLEGFTSSGWK